MSKSVFTVYNETAKAIQAKKESTEPINPDNFGSEILNLKGSELESFNVPVADRAILLHLDKLKQNLPQSVLNREFHIVENSGYRLTSEFTNVLGETVTMYSLNLILFDVFRNDNLNKISFDLGNSLTLRKPEGYSIDIAIYAPDQDDKYISNIYVFDGITFSELLDNIIEANGSNVISLDTITSSGEGYGKIYSTNIYWSDWERGFAEGRTIPNINQILTLADPVK